MMNQGKSMSAKPLTVDGTRTGAGRFWNCAWRTATIIAQTP